MNQLSQLAKLYNTDKIIHGYTDIYFNALNHLKNQSLTLLEIGVGGYTNPTQGGESLKMWSDFFPNAHIHGVDVYIKTIPGNFQIHQADQTDKYFFENLIQLIGEPTIIIDDASHINPLTIKTFEILFPLLKSNGIYIIEDTQTAYIEKDFAGDPASKNPNTITNYLFSIINHLNQFNDNNNPKSIQFFKQLAIIYKWK